jgi:hypothetical protein
MPFFWGFKLADPVYRVVQGDSPLLGYPEIDAASSTETQTVIYQSTRHRIPDERTVLGLL